MATIHLRKLYPFYKKDNYIEITDEVAALLASFEQAEASYERKVRRHKAFYSLDQNNGVEHSILFAVLSPEELYERKLAREELRTAIARLPDRQSKRIDAHFLLEMSKDEIAKAEGVSWHSVHQSIRQGLVYIEKFLKESE